MSVYRRGNKMIIDYYPQGRRGKHVRYPLPPAVTEEQAREIEADLKRAARGTPKAGTRPDHTVAALFDDYLSWYSLHRAPSTYRDVSFVWLRHLSRLLGKERLSSLGPHHIHLYQRIRKGEGVCNRTINKEVAYFSGFLKWCQRDRGIAVSPPRTARMPSKRPLPIVLSREEAVSIIEASEPIYRAMMVLLYSLGLRFSEARFLKWDDIDRENHALRVVQKGGSYKILPLNDWAESCIKALGEGKAGDYVFLSARNREEKKPIRDIRKAIARACEKAGIQKKVTPHLFRHSIATHLLGQDVNLRTIQQYLGHAQVAATEFYTHVDLGHLRAASEGLFGKSVYTKPPRKTRGCIRRVK